MERSQLSKAKVKYSPELVKASQVCRESSRESSLPALLPYLGHNSWPLCFCLALPPGAGLCWGGRLSCGWPLEVVAIPLGKFVCKGLWRGSGTGYLFPQQPSCSQGNCFETREKGAKKHWVKWGRENTAWALCFCMNICFHLMTYKLYLPLSINYHICCIHKYTIV